MWLFGVVNSQLIESGFALVGFLVWGLFGFWLVSSWAVVVCCVLAGVALEWVCFLERADWGSDCGLVFVGGLAGGGSFCVVWALCVVVSGVGASLKSM